MSDEDGGVTIENNQTSRSYDAYINGKLAAVIVYELEADRVVFTHEVVEPAFRGHGVANELARQALDDVRAQSKTLSNYCEFVASFIDKHPAYADLVDPQHPGFVRHHNPGPGPESDPRSP